MYLLIMLILHGHVSHNQMVKNMGKHVQNLLPNRPKEQKSNHSMICVHIYIYILYIYMSSAQNPLSFH